ncbi:hypothetical protein M231_02867 [Tremella mesenterica]|uniref:Glycosyltransferase 61 catalytic domain-containing protein n=1 Tax=Tremella mesenterica TaxID=5217 RepID=A0A4Q1BPW7_TREME|nr:hypothetical protein M231_02867 [Tremella mesenterica]
MSLFLPLRRYWPIALGLITIYLILFRSSLPFYPQPDITQYTSDIGFLPTKVLSHVPGYTILENAYYHGGKIRIYTEEPWAFPAIDDIARHEDDDRVTEHSDVEIIQILGDAWSYDNDPVWLRFPHMLHHEMVTLGQSAEEVPGVTFGTMDRQYLNHYYHFIGEHLFPLWKVWAKAYERYHVPEPMVSHMSFFNADSGPSDVRGVDTSHRWADRAGVNTYTLNKAFPGIKITTKDEWDPIASSNRLLRFPYLLLTSRRAGHGGPNSAFKPYGDVLRLPIGTQDWWADMRERLLAGHSAEYGPARESRPVITYLSRQSTGRRLANESHDALVEELETLSKSGRAEVRYEVFEDTSIPEQWARIARTTILLGVHGNGLTHIIFLPINPGSAVYELQPENCQINDYAPLALARGIPHWIVQNDRMCGPTECGIRGCHEGARINSEDIKVDSRALVDHIRGRLGIPPRGH